MDVKRIPVLAAAVPLAVGLCLTNGAGAQASGAVTYECGSVYYWDTLFEKPVNGASCTGPVGPATGLVRETPTGKTYSCATLTGMSYAYGVWVVGRNCELV